MRLYKRNTITAAVAGTGLAGADKNPTYIEFEGADEKTAFIVNATATDTITVVAGSGSVNTRNITLSVPEGISVFTLDSAFFMDAAGTNKGKVGFIGKTTTSIATVVLP